MANTFNILQFSTQGLVQAARVFYSGGTGGDTMKVKQIHTYYIIFVLVPIVFMVESLQPVDMTLMLIACPLEVSFVNRKGDLGCSPPG